MDTYTIIWGTGIIGILVCLVGGVWYVNALRGIGGAFKESQMYIMGASMSWTLYSIVMVTLGLKQVPLTSPWWYVMPVAYTITAIFFITGTYKLVKTIQAMNTV